MRKYVLGLAAVLFPAWLLLPDGRGFYVDWFNHVWIVGYYGEYLHQHGRFPTVLNTPEIGGVAFPVFYGYLFYPLLGLAAVHLNPELVVRGAVVALLAAQYASVRKAMRRLRADEGAAAGVASGVIWATYALTNLYNRSALTEYFAVGVLTCAVCAWFDLLRAGSAGAGWRHGLRFGLLLTLAMGFHPITGLYSLPLLGVLVLALPGRRAPLGRVAAVCAVAGAASVVVLAPWVYAVHKLAPELSMADSTAVVELFPPLDRWAVRLNPLPTDYRCNDAPAQAVSTPFLDSQVALPLLVLGAGVAAAAVRRAGGGARALAFLAAPLLYAAAMLYLSTHPGPLDHLPPAFKAVQFLYRIVSYVNLGFLMLPLFALLWAARAAGAPRVAVSPVLVCFAVTYAGCCAYLKLQHAEAGRLPTDRFVQAWAARGRAFDPVAAHARWVKSPADREMLVHLPITSYGHSGYGTPRLLPPLSPDEGPLSTVRYFEAEGEGKAFGDFKPLAFTAPHPMFVGTQVLVFPWNRFTVDGRVLPAEELRVWGESNKCTAVLIPPGTHTVRYQFVPPRKWRVLHMVSQYTLAAWFLALGGLSVVGAVRARRARPAAAVATPEPGSPPRLAA